MALVSTLNDWQMNGRHRQLVKFLDSTSVTEDGYSDVFASGNITGACLWVKATSAIGTPSFILSVETSKDQTSANFLQVNPPCLETTFPVTISDENVHIYTLNLSCLHEYTRFKIDLQGSDPGDDVITLHAEFFYGSVTLPQTVTVSTDVSLTEFPAAAALSDNFANPTTTNVASMLMGYDGSTWDRIRGDSSNGLATYRSRVSATPTSTTLSVGTSSTQLVASNANRKTLIVTNTHATQRVTMNFGSTAVIDTGITIMPGGAYSMSELDYYSGQINVIASGASTVLSIAEF